MKCGDVFKSMHHGQTPGIRAVSCEKAKATRRPSAGKLPLDSAQHSVRSALVFRFLTQAVLWVLLLPCLPNGSPVESLSRTGEAHRVVNPCCTGISWGAVNHTNRCLSFTLRVLISWPRVGLGHLYFIREIQVILMELRLRTSMLKP